MLLVGRSAAEEPCLKCVLVLPPGGQAWSEAANRLDTVLKDTQWWYSCQMEALGYGAKTFALETDDRGKVVIHIVRLPREPEIPAGASRESEPASGARSATILEAEKVMGNPRQRKGSIMVLVYDGYYWTDREKLQMLPMGYGANGHWAHLSGWHLHGLNPACFTEATPVRELSEQNPFFPPLATKIYQAGGDSGTVGERASGSYGTFFHEIGHSFGLHHPPAGSPRIAGDVMSDYWTARGNFVPNLQGAFCALTPEEAAIVNKCPLFQVRQIGGSSTGAPRGLGAKGAFDPAIEFKPARFAPVNLSGSGYTIEVFGKGRKSQSNRDYIWSDLPSQLEGYRFTRTAGGVTSQIVAQVQGKGRIYVANGASYEPTLEAAGWQMTRPTISYSSQDGKRSYPMYIYFKEVLPGAAVPIPQSQWTGTILIAP